MAEVPIPAASLERLRQTYAQFEQLSIVIAEAMGLANGTVTSVNLQAGVFETKDEGESATIIDVPAERLDGVPA